eukprot:11201222-Lingulodinium_polyedra.AAC.1
MWFPKKRWRLLGQWRRASHGATAIQRNSPPENQSRDRVNFHGPKFGVLCPPSRLTRKREGAACPGRVFLTR